MSFIPDDIEDLLIIVSIIFAVIFIGSFIHLWRQKSASENYYRTLEEKIEFLMKYKDKPSLTFESEMLYRKISPQKWDDLNTKKYCILTFDSTRTSLVDSLVQDCFEGRKREKNLQREVVVVNQRNDILTIPSCQVVLIFVEKNKDDVILESPGYARDDLKLLTVKSCRKTNADVFVTYFGDDDSENLMPGLLYNPQIAAVTEHPELKELERFDRVITCCYKKFTTTQREKIAEYIV